MRKRTFWVVGVTLFVLLGLATGMRSALAQAPDTQAGRILAATGIQGGLIVHVGCGDGVLTAALGAGEKIARQSRGHFAPEDRKSTAGWALAHAADGERSW